jgi:hypothetical protein
MFGHPLFVMWFALVLCVYVVLFMPSGRLPSKCVVKNRTLLLVYGVREIGKDMVAILEYVVCFKIGTKDQDLWGSRLYDIMHILHGFVTSLFQFVLTIMQSEGTVRKAINKLQN